LNILLLGSDAGIGRTGVRTDTMVVVSIDPATGDVALFSLPRNLAQVPLPDSIDIWACDCFPLILNELYGYGQSHPDSFPGPSNPGANAIKAGIGELLGIPIQYYALVALDGFVDLVDAVGGVTVTVTERVYDPAYPHEDGTTEVIDFQPGVYDLDGHQALAYARSRYSSDDYNRMGRQRCVIQAMVEQASPFDLLRGFPAIAETLKQSLETDIPLERIPDLIELLPDADIDGAVSLRLIPPVYNAGRNSGGYPLPNVERIREHVAIVMELPPEEAIVVLGIEPLADACD
jgi:LCP family protein required for cell wall assembly